MATRSTSATTTNKLVKIEPADFLNAKDRKVPRSSAAQKVNTNGLYPSRTGMLYIVGFAGPKNPQSIHALGISGQTKRLSDAFGGLDGVC
jgi:hypothetical protein